jgi:PAS domain S-box-containing protein
MISLLRNIPIRRKLTLITMLTSCVALMLTCLAFVTYEQMVFRGWMVSDLSSMAKMIGDNSAAALSFNDPASAEQTLKSLSADPHVIGGAIYDKDGKPFARYQRSAGSPFVPPAVKAEHHQFGQNTLEMFHSIALAGESVGTVYLLSDLEAMRNRLWRYAAIVGVVMPTALLLAFLLSCRLQRVISEPISHVAAIASAVATDRNYSIRAVKQSEDELGRLIDGFNEMLGQIQARDVELRKSQDLLEKRVQERTGELQQEIADHQRSAKALSETNQRFEIVTRATTDVIWDWDLKNDTVCWNENFQVVFGYQPGEVGSDVESWTARIHPDDLPAINQSLHAVLDGGGHLWSGEYRFRRRDGSYAFVFDRGYVLHDEQRRPVRMIGAMQDFTERKRAEAELEQAHRQLLDVSRQAGMAEVATGVLHNVGNVLNSVNVSATLVADHFKQSKVTKLGRAVALMREHAADLGTYLTVDPKGKQVPIYLGDLAGHMAAEEARALQEVESLRQNIEHIKDIVAMQQSYAKVSGVAEIIKATDLVDDSLRMNAAALARHDIKVAREFEELPPISVEKHKVLQILVNLIRNAKYACDESGQAQKQITVRVSRLPQVVRIAISDNGVGIPPENLTRIFAHGFTTKKTGHGFGLHSGALAAKEMGGSLQAQSDGVGCGATFTLDLPFESLKRAA